MRESDEARVIQLSKILEHELEKFLLEFQTTYETDELRIVYSAQFNATIRTALTIWLDGTCDIDKIHEIVDSIMGALVHSKFMFDTGQTMDDYLD